MLKILIRSLISSLMCFLVIVLPAPCRNVYFDSANSNPALHAQLKPYCVDVRKRVEEIWEKADPREGGDIQLIFCLGQNGELLNVFPRTLEENSLRERAVYSVVETARAKLPPLPAGQGSLVVLATFKSKPLTVKRGMKPETRRLLEDAVIAGALIGLTGLAIYALLKFERNNGGFIANGQTNPNFHWVNPFYDSNGAYHHGYWQTNANQTMMDNFSSVGNTNPFTGQPGYIVPRY
jgi:hypothetical protein